jgi:drug/metabolite transporter (DMT)-like permease
LSIAAIFLLIISAIVHAGWNMIGKSNQPSIAIFLIGNTLGCIFLSLTLFWSWPTFTCIPVSVWLLLIAAGFFQALYYVGIIFAYRQGDFSLAYPLARSAPVVIVVIISYLIGRGGQLSPVYLMGAGIVFVGIFLTPQQQFGKMQWKDFLNPVVLFCLVAACGTTGYSMVDDQGLRILRSVPGLPVDGSTATLMYALLEAVFSSLWLGLIVIISPANRKEMGEIIHDSKCIRYSALMGCGIYIAYTLVLVSMGFAKNVSYVVTFRQLSIPLGAVMGMMVFHEPKLPTRIAGVCMIFAGLVLVGIG